MAQSDHPAGVKERTILLVVWFFFFLLNGGCILFLYLKGWIGQDNLFDGLRQWNTVYAPYIGAITLFCWGSAGRGQQGRANKSAFYTALVCSLLWNGVVFAFLLPPLLGTGAIETALKNIGEVASLFSWLSAGAIGYYFAEQGIA